jgi:hypothetical protein
VVQTSVDAQFERCLAFRRVGVRSPSLREAMKINGGSRIVECTSPEGPLLVCVMPNELDHVLTALNSNGAA